MVPAQSKRTRPPVHPAHSLSTRCLHPVHPLSTPPHGKVPEFRGWQKSLSAIQLNCAFGKKKFSFFHLLVVFPPPFLQLPPKRTQRLLASCSSAHTQKKKKKTLPEILFFFKKNEWWYVGVADVFAMWSASGLQGGRALLQPHVPRFAEQQQRRKPSCWVTAFVCAGLWGGCFSWLSILQ